MSGNEHQEYETTDEVEYRIDKFDDWVSMGFCFADVQSYQEYQVYDQGTAQKQVDPDVSHFLITKEIDQDQ